MKIICLEAENVKHLRVVNIRPDGSMVIVGGDNSAGKSCVLDSIEYALGGAGAVPIKPIRDGQKKARIVLDLGDIQVTRTFTSKGTTLTVKNKEGVVFASPQTMLDKLVGELTFDPLEFSKMDSKKQLEVLKKLVGLDFNAIDAKYNKLFEERTVVNRHGKSVKANLEAMTHHEGIPDQEVSVSDLSKEYAAAIEHNRKIETAHNDLKSKMNELKILETKVKDLKGDIRLKQKDLEGIGEMVNTISIQEQMTGAEKINSHIRENRDFAKIDKEVIELRKQSILLSEQMSDIAETKEKALAKAEFPVKGLDIDSDGVTFDDIPFSQCSSAQQIKISVAIGLAMNPKLRVLLIREGSLLDEKSLGMIAKMADDADAQVWLERVGKGSECSVILEDGSVLEKINV
jgi:hypothetical protein